jgi:hypothetical protein
MQKNTWLISIVSPFIRPLVCLLPKHGMVLALTPRTCTYLVVNFWSLTPDHDLKKSDSRACQGQFYGYAKIHSLLCRKHPVTGHVKHAHGARFLELDPLLPASTPYQRLLQLDPAPSCTSIELPSFLTSLLTLTIELILRRSPLIFKSPPCWIVIRFEISF